IAFMKSNGTPMRFAAAADRYERTPRPLASRREQADARRNGHVERFDVSRKRDADDAITGLSCETPQASAFRAQHPCDRTGEIGVEQVFGAVGVGGHDPDAALLERAKRAREIGHA